MGKRLCCRPPELSEVWGSSSAARLRTRPQDRTRASKAPEPRITASRIMSKYDY